MTSEPSTEAANQPAAPTSQPAAPASQVVELPRRSGAGSTITILAGGLVVALGVASFPLWRDQAGLSVPSGGFEVENLRAELSAANARFAEMDAKLNQVAAPAPAPAAAASGPDPVLAGRLSQVEQSVRAIQAQPPVPATLTADVESIGKQVADLRKTAADAATLLRLADRVDQAEAALRELQSRRSSAAALLLAVGQVREAVALGQPFDAELRALKVLAGDDAETLKAVELLKDRAGAGIASRLTLIDRFSGLAPRLIRAEILPEGQSWWRPLADRLLSLVTIRREDGEAAGSAATAIVARAQAALARADLAVAVTELEALTGGSAQLAAGWSAEAKSRLVADRALSELAAHAVALAGAKP
ncbi:conserved hypothetical protein [Candidatus Terasakiella magnetica]|nr:conserved hypothetical protein [Candidatus Terasakiella magnetica]